MQRLSILAVVGLAVFSTVAAAQTPQAVNPAGPATTPAVKSPPPPAVREAKPSVYFVKDKNGELVPLVGFSLEEFERMLAERGDDATAPAKPKFRIDDIAAIGDADPRNARVEIAFTIVVDDANWVRVPLGLGGTVLEKQADHEGPGQFTLQYDATAKEYFVWLKAEAGSTHRLKLRTVTPLVLDGATKTLHLRMPGAWHSSLKLNVPEASLTVQPSPGVVLGPVVAADGGHRIEVSGLTGDFHLAWTKTDATAKQAQALLEAQVDVAAAIDGHSISYDAQLAVSSFGGEFERFKIRLPPSAVLVADEDTTEFSIQKLPPAKNEKSESYEVHRLAGPTKSMIVRIHAVRPIEAGKGPPQFDLGGIEVDKAVRQWGHLGVSVVGDWQVVWGERTQIRQVDAAPEFLRGRNTAAIFEYFGRTFSLNTKISPRETRVSVDPAYVVDVTSRRAYLEAKLGYRVGGAKVFTLEADFLDWQIDEVGPPELIDIEKIAVGKGGPISMPLLEPSTGEFEITVRAHRDLAEGATALELFVPRPTAGVVGPASWTVRAAENVLLAPREASHAGLNRQTRGDARRFSGERASWTYSIEAPDAKFAADYRVVRRTIRVGSRAEVALGAAGSATQKLDYVVAREPIDALEFDVPAALTESEKLELRDAGEVLPWVVIDEGSEDARSAARIRVNLPQARIGEFQLTATYPVALERPTSQASTVVKIPLLVPIEGELVDNELKLVPEDEIVIQHVDEAWTPEAAVGAAPVVRTASYRSASSRLEAAVGVRWAAAQADHQAFVDRSWIQSVFLGDGRWERAVFRLGSPARSVTIRLPAGHSSIVALVDGRRVALDDETTGANVVVPLESTADDQHVVDLRYQVADAAHRDDEALTGPTISGAAVNGQLLRQVVYPADTILWNASPEYVSENNWTRQGALWMRTPRIGQSELEKWCGATAEPPLPEGANVYVFSSYGGEAPFLPSTIKRSRLVIFASAAVLACAMAFLFFPVLRRPGVLVVVGIAMCALGFTYPDAVPAVLQASVIGALLAFAAVLLERNFLRRSGRAVRSTIEAASAVPRGSTRTRLVPPTPSSAAGPAADLPAPSSAAGGLT